MNGRAAGMMLVAAVSFGAIPLLFDVSDAGESPFLFNGATNFGQAVLLLVALRASRRMVFPTGRGEDVWRVGNVVLCWDRESPSPVARRPKTPGDWMRAPVLWGVVGALTFGSYALATRYVATATVVGIFQLWPVFSVLLLGRLGKHLERDGVRPHFAGHQEIVLVIAAFAGAFLVVMAEGGGFSVPGGRVVVGIGFALAAGVLAALAAPASVSMGHMALGLREERGVRDGHAVGQLVWFSIFGMFWVRAAAAPINVALGLANGESFAPGLVAAGMGVALLDVIGMVLSRRALYVSANLANLAALYLSPVVSLTVLATFRGLDVPRPELLVAGTALIILTTLRSLFAGLPQRAPTVDRAGADSTNK